MSDNHDKLLTAELNESTFHSIRSSAIFRILVPTSQHLEETPPKASFVRFLTTGQDNVYVGAEKYQNLTETTSL